MGAIGVLSAQLIANVFALIICLPLIIKNLQFKLDIPMLKEMLIFGVPTIPASISQIILQISDRPIIKALKGASDVGIYGVNYRLGIPMMMLVSMFEYAWKPFYLSHYEEDDAKSLFARIFTYFTLAASLVFLTTSFFIGDLVRFPIRNTYFITSEYWQGLGIIPIVLLGYYFNGAFNNFAAGLQITKKTKYFPYAVGVSAIVNIAMNFALIPKYGYIVAAWSTLISYIVSAALLYYYSQKAYKISYEWKRLSILIGSAALTYGIVTSLIPHDLSIVYISIKLLAILVFMASLKFMGFFTKAELNQIKLLLKRK
jgi:O-antigen/teichoic acid export membrane protein